MIYCCNVAKWKYTSSLNETRYSHRTEYEVNSCRHSFARVCIVCCPIHIRNRIEQFCFVFKCCNSPCDEVAK